MRISDLLWITDFPEKIDLVEKALENYSIPLWLYDLLILEQNKLRKKYPHYKQ